MREGGSLRGIRHVLHWNCVHIARAEVRAGLCPAEREIERRDTLIATLCAALREDPEDLTGRLAA